MTGVLFFLEFALNGLSANGHDAALLIVAAVEMSIHTIERGIDRGLDGHVGGLAA